MSKSLQGKVALVTGGSRGLGAATARSLADAGADVAITFVASADRAAELVQELQDKGVQGAAFQANASLARQLIDDVVARFDGLDILVNNAAIGVESGKTTDDPNIDTGELDRMHATNYTGIIAIIRAAAKVLRDNGRIVTIGSGIGSRAGRPGFTDYAATKTGLIGYTKGAPCDLARRGITVKIVQAGLMQTQMVRPSPEVLKAKLSGLAIQRVSDPAETAAVITFLSSPTAISASRIRTRSTGLSRTSAASRVGPAKPAIGSGARNCCWPSWTTTPTTSIEPPTRSAPSSTTSDRSASEASSPSGSTTTTTSSLHSAARIPKNQATGIPTDLR